MAIVLQPEKREKITINLNGPEGNVFTLLGYATSFSKQLGIDSQPILAEMMSKDYTNAVQVFNKYFGENVILETTSESLYKILTNQA